MTPTILTAMAQETTEVAGILPSPKGIGILDMVLHAGPVVPGIAEALVATAMGLAAAIPAVVAYNHFSNKINAIEDKMLQFTADFLNTLKTDLTGETGQAEAASTSLDIVRERRGMCGCMEAGPVKTG